MKQPTKFVAELHHVREVTLVGTADAPFWRERLSRQNLAPVESYGGAKIIIIAADARYAGLKFRELSFSVAVTPPGGVAGDDAAYLLRAFNSNRFFAFSERMFFSTPYYHGDVRVTAQCPACIQLVKNRKMSFRAEMHADGSAPAREPSRRGEERWDGPVFLPVMRSRQDHAGKMFFAQISGETRAYPFIPGQDTLTITPSGNEEALQSLVTSGFVAKEWMIRSDATHAKSKTYSRTEVLQV